MTEMAKEKAPINQVAIATKVSRIAGAILIAIVILAFFAPTFLPRSMIQDLFFLVTMIGLAQCWNLLAGYGGLVSVGQQAFVGLGAYISFGAAILLGLDPLLAILVAALAGTLLAVPTAYVVFRLKGAYFAIGTWVAAEVYRLLFAQWTALGGGTGTSMPSDIARSMVGIDLVRDLLGLRSSAARDVLSYWLALIAVILITGFAYALLRSREGLALSAIRDNETAAESVGVDSNRAKLVVYLFAAAGASLVGGLIFFQKASLTPDSAFSLIDWTAYVIFITVIGGIGTLEGPIIGALILLALQAWLAEYGSWYLMLLGLLGIVVMLFAPRGIWGFIQERYDFSIFPTRRRLIGPSGPAPEDARPVKAPKAAPSNLGVSGADIRLEEPMFDIETDVLIVGSGPAGAASALLLSTYGVGNVMVERYAWLANTPRAHITNQRTMEILRELGVEEDAKLHATPQELMGNNIFCTSLAGEELGRLLTWGNHPSRRADYELASPCKICDLPQTLLEPVLVNAAAARGSILRFKTDYLSHTQDGEHVVATVKDRVSGGTYRIRAKYMIGADGARSLIAEQLGLPMDGRMGIEGSMNILFKADLSSYVAHRPSVLYWMFQPGAEIGGLGAGVIRMIRPWTEWMGMYGYKVADGPPDLSDAEAEVIVRKLIGDDEIPIEITGKSYWTVNHMSARHYSKGRVFCMGDAVHRHPPTNGLGSNTSIQDAYNLCWKLKLVLDGKAAPSLLATYDQERPPVGKQIVDRANKSIEDYGPIVDTLGLTLPGTPEERMRRMESLKQPTTEAAARRKVLDKLFRHKSYEFNCHGVEMNQRYRSDAIVPDGTPEPEFIRDRELYYQATTWPGAKIPHVWLEHGGEKLSTLDLVGRGRFTLLTGIAGDGWIEAAARLSADLGVEIRAFQIGPGCEVADPFGDWAQVREVEDSGCILVRPDGHVCFRARDISARPLADLSEVLEQIVGLGPNQK